MSDRRDLPIYTNEDYLMHSEANRLKSFKKWPFDKSCPCNKHNLAKAGFYHIPTENEPDAVRCFICYKELDGWEPDDDPWDEHHKHSSKCHFLHLDKPIEKMTLKEFLKLEIERQKNKIRKAVSVKMKEIDDYSLQVGQELPHLLDS